jgi:hypothetical protein
MAIGLVAVALLTQVADLVTFLVAVATQPALLGHEIGVIRLTYLDGGPLGAIAFKLAGLAIVFAGLAIYRGRLVTPILVGVALLGGIGAFANMHALASVLQV